MKALIFAGGEFDGLPEDVCLKDFSIILAADKGYHYAEKSGVLPHIFVGDLDSFNDESAIKSPEIFRLTPEKDMTDTEKAVEIAISRGTKEILILGALGGRIDHTLGNIQLLKLGLERGVQVILADKNQYITLTDSTMKIPKKEGCCLSLIPLSPCIGVTITGVYYPLSCAPLPLGSSLGVSNEFTEETAHLSVTSGEVLVMVCKK